MNNEVVIRPIHRNELAQLLDLYKHLHTNDPELCVDDLESLWERIFKDPNMHYLVAEREGSLVASCVLVIVPNLTRSARPYGWIENVVTHQNFRRMGYGSKVLKRALELAWEQNCYKVMLLSGSTEEGTLLFYENIGFKKGVKTGFIAAPAPEMPC